MTQGFESLFTIPIMPLLCEAQYITGKVTRLGSAVISFDPLLYYPDQGEEQC